MINFNKLCLLILLGTVAYNEFFCFYLAYLSWPRLPASDDLTSSTVLFIADPQIQGTRHEPPGILGTLSRWDSDRYLGSMYSWVTSYSTSAIVFLGDLIDEGSEATRDEFNTYADRFLALFPPARRRLTIYLPGDNDIGGEGVDPVTLDKISRFEAKFGPAKPIYNISPVLDIVPVSRLTEHGAYNLTAKVDQLSRGKLVVAVSHVPVLPLNGRFAERVVNLLSPDIIFSGHDHRGFVFTADRQSLKMKQNSRDLKVFRKDGDITPITITTRHSTDASKSLVEMSDTLLEIVVPTSSYRMGVKEMGVGLAVFREGGEVTYHNLWLPARFPHLFLYIASLTCVLCLFLFGKFLDFRRRAWRKVDAAASLRKI